MIDYYEHVLIMEIRGSLHIAAFDGFIVKDIGVEDIGTSKSTQYL